MALTPLLLLLLSFAPVALSLDISVNVTRLISTIETLATYNDLDPPSVQRILFTVSDIDARAYVNDLFTSANLTVQEDALGNMFAVWHGTSAMTPIATGSHIDAIPHSGMYDGTVGVLGAIEAIRSLQAAGFQPKRDIHVIMFTSEEPTRFGIGCLGSRVLSGAMEPSDADLLTDVNGILLEQSRNAAGFSGTLDVVPLLDDEYAAFVELHIEQADSLEKDGIDIGAVTAIAAPAQLKVKFSGSGGHAGALAMTLRRDALLAAAEMALEVERVALNTGSDFSVATVGEMEVFPGVVNSVPREVQMGIDVRDIDQTRRDDMVKRIRTEAERIGKEREMEVSVEVVNADPPVTCDDIIVRAVEDAAKAGGLSVRQLVSRAYHDSLFMAKKFPAGMIFVPCRSGVSHHPDEHVSERDLENGVQTLAHVLATLANLEDDEPQKRTQEESGNDAQEKQQEDSQEKQQEDSQEKQQEDSQEKSRGEPREEPREEL